MRTEDYPALFCAADSAAAHAQRHQVVFSFFDLAALVIAAVAAALSPIDARVSGASFDVMVAVTAFVLIVSLGLSLAGRTARSDKRWFAARAIAESVKTETWRYIMRPAQQEDDARFRRKLKEILGSQPDAH